MNSKCLCLTLLLLACIPSGLADQGPRAGVLKVNFSSLGYGVGIQDWPPTIIDNAPFKYYISETYTNSVSCQAEYEVFQTPTNLIVGNCIKASSVVSLSGEGRQLANGNLDFAWVYVIDPACLLQTNYSAVTFLPDDTTLSTTTPLWGTSAWQMFPANTHLLECLVPYFASDEAGHHPGLKYALKAFGWAQGQARLINFALPAKPEPWSLSLTTNISVSTNIDNASYDSYSGNVRNIISLELAPENPAPLEAVFDMNAPWPAPAVRVNHEDWIPEGSTNRNAAAWDGGNLFYVTVKLRWAESRPDPAPLPMATFKFLLSDISRERGICMNYPPLDSRTHLDPDLRFENAPGLEAIYWPDGTQTAETTVPATSATVCIRACDFAAFGRLSAVVTTQNQPFLVAHLENNPGLEGITLPKDDNGNHIADAWEIAKGTYGQIQDPKWDGAGKLNDHRCTGDGISLFEKYRGFRFRGIHERLLPDRKYVFVFDEQGAVLKMERAPDGPRFSRASDFLVRFVDEQGWTGPGKAADGKRIVNFNGKPETHAVDQHALHVRVTKLPDPMTPLEYDTVAHLKNAVDPSERVNLRGVRSSSFGTHWPDPPGFALGDSPKNSFMISVSMGNQQRFTFETVLYHTMGLPEFGNWEVERLTMPPDEKARKLAQGTNLANAYIAANLPDRSRRNRLFLQTCLVHEMGHGLGIPDLIEAQCSAGPVNCAMRYFNKGEFGRIPGDRFELYVREILHPWPDIYCLSPVGTPEGIPCRHQIKVTDGPIGSGGRVARQDPKLSPFKSSLAGDGGANASTTILEPSPAPPLELELLPRWSQFLEGDPLPITVRLSCSQHLQSELAALMKGLTNASLIPPVAVNSNWPSQLALELTRLDSFLSVPPYMPGAPVLLSNAWTTLLQPDAGPADTEFGLAQTEFTRDYLASPNAVNLVSGAYLLRATWNGRGMTDPAGFPSSGVLAASDRLILVSPITNDVQRAEHEERLALCAYSQGDVAAAREHALAALQFSGTVTNLDTTGLRVLAANAAVRLGQYRQAAALLLDDANRGQAGERSIDNRNFLQALLPEIRLSGGGYLTGPVSLSITALPGETYTTQGSANLIDWQPLDTRKSQTNVFEVMDALAHQPFRFYRVVWEGQGQ